MINCTRKILVLQFSFQRTGGVSVIVFSSTPDILQSLGIERYWYIRCTQILTAYMLRFCACFTHFRCFFSSFSSIFFGPFPSYLSVFRFPAECGCVWVSTELFTPNIPFGCRVLVCRVIHRLYFVCFSISLLSFVCYKQSSALLCICLFICF